MGLLNRLFSGSDPKFSRPFHKNETTADLKEWFAKAPNWKALDSRITDVLIERLQGNPMFEVFVHLSWDTGLIKEYAALGKSLESRFSEPQWAPMFSEALCANITKILYRTGCSNRDRVVELMRSSRCSHDELKKHYRFAMDAFECSINMQPTFLLGYLALAALKHLVNRPEEAREFCDRGLAQAEKMKEDMKTVPFPADIRNAIEEGEAKLRELLREL